MLEGVIRHNKFIQGDEAIWRIISLSMWCLADRDRKSTFNGTVGFLPGLKRLIILAINRLPIVIQYVIYYIIPLYQIKNIVNIMI